MSANTHEVKQATDTARVAANVTAAQTVATQQAAAQNTAVQTAAAQEKLAAEERKKKAGPVTAAGIYRAKIDSAEVREAKGGSRAVHLTMTVQDDGEHKDGQIEADLAFGGDDNETRKRGEEQLTSLKAALGITTKIDLSTLGDTANGQTVMVEVGGDRGGVTFHPVLHSHPGQGQALPGTHRARAGADTANLF